MAWPSAAACWNSPPSSGYWAARPVGSTKRAVRLARLTTLPTMSAFTLRDELVQAQIEVVHPRAELRGVVVTQIGGVEVLQVRRGADERPFRFRHLLAVDGEEAVDVDLRRQAESGRLQHGRPEERVEIGDVLADEMVDLRRPGSATNRRNARPGGRTTAASRPCSRWGRRTRRTSNCPGCRESRNRNTAPAATRPSRAGARPGNDPSSNWRSPPARPRSGQPTLRGIRAAARC